MEWPVLARTGRNADARPIVTELVEGERLLLLLVMAAGRVAGCLALVQAPYCQMVQYKVRPDPAPVIITGSLRCRRAGRNCLLFVSGVGCLLS